MSRLIVSVPETYLPERNYILNVFLGDFLGLDYAVTTHRKPEVVIKMVNINDRILILEDTLFQTPAEQWLNSKSLPKSPPLRWNVIDDLPEAIFCDPELPVLYGRQIANGKLFHQQDGLVHLGLDILGSSFFMLTRYEEVVLRERDQHERFPARSSIAYKEGFLERPVVNEYLEVLWAAMQRLWPGLQRKPRQFKVFPTHDVDNPFAVNGLPVTRAARSCLGDLLKRKSLALAVKRCQSWLNTKKYGLDYDLYNTFDYLMDKSEEKGLKSAFYFMAGCTNKKYEGSYALHDPWMRRLLRKIHQRGHEIGFHPSYETYQDPQKTVEEFQYLQKICREENIQQERWGGRQHYLRWDASTTWRNWEAAGLYYDSTVGYADHPGFRCGTCYEFPVFDLQTRKKLNLRERPLIVMEGTLLGENYLGLDHDHVWEHINRLIDACWLFQGDFILLGSFSNKMTKTGQPQVLML
ncbi:MAG: polysaccharide deacetylase family protein [Bacillota bacterium]